MREIRWTDKSEDYIAAHNITPEEVEQVLYARPRLVLKGPDGRGYVVTARNMTDAERQAFRRKGR